MDKVTIPTSINRFEYIDTLRGIAVIMVIFYHTNQVAMPVYNKYIALLNSLGARGVQLFFLISAFTLYYSKTKRAARGEHSNKAFFLRRFFRLAPLYYLALLYFIWQASLGGYYWINPETDITLSKPFIPS